MPINFKGFASLLYYHLIASGKHEIKSVAEKMPVEASTLYKYAEGELTFPPDLISPLINATDGTDAALGFANFLLTKTKYRPALRSGVALNGRTIQQEVNDVVVQVGRMASSLNRIMEDEKL